MLTGLACWLLYIASYSIIYIIISFCVMYNCFIDFQNIDTFQSLSRTQQIIHVAYHEKVILIVLFFLFIFSISWARYIKTWKNNTRIKFRMSDDSKIDESAFILPYIFTVVTFNFDIYGWIICILIYLSVGFLFVQTRKLQMSPIFILSRYHILTDGTNKVITRNSVESFNLKLDDSPDGIEVRELAKNIFITLDQ
ncbi:MAG: hypothetical protein SOY47_10990 [Lachnospiraceae bacterium]|nr:hypothetical protein [Lachnospiraceae bacterium]